MPSHRHYYQGSGLEPGEARRIALAMFARRRGKPILVGPVCLEIGKNYGLNETEGLLDELVREGVLRVATAEELGSKRQRGYVLVVACFSQIWRKYATLTLRRR